MRHIMQFFAEIRQKSWGGGVKSPLKFCRASAKLIRTLVITFVIFLTPFSSHATDVSCKAGTRIWLPGGGCTTENNAYEGFFYNGTNNWATMDHTISDDMVSPVIYCPMGFDGSNDHMVIKYDYPNCGTASGPAGYSYLPRYGGMPVRYIKITIDDGGYYDLVEIQAFTGDPTGNLVMNTAEQVNNYSSLRDVPELYSGDTAATDGDSRDYSRIFINYNEAIWELRNGTEWILLIRFAIRPMGSNFSNMRIWVSEDEENWTEVFGPLYGYIPDNKYLGSETPFITVMLPPLEYIQKNMTTPCDAGTYSTGAIIQKYDTFFVDCNECTGATYQDQPGQSSCKNVDVGFYRSSNSAQAQCPAGYRNIAASSQNECVGTFTKSGQMLEPALPAGCASQVTTACTVPTCEYTKKYNGTTVTDCTPGNCTKTITSVVADNDHYANGTMCPVCPNGWRSPLGATDVGDCGRILAYQPNGAPAPTRIYLRSGKEKRTHPSLAAMIDGHVFYGNMTPVETTVPGNMYVGYDNKTYNVHNDVHSSFFATARITNRDKTFSFKISAAGTFTIDWGDGNVQEITRTDTSIQSYTHTYASAGTYTIGLGGRATGYNPDTIAAISFGGGCGVLTGISGSLGAVFPTIDENIDTGQPKFYQTFYGCMSLSGSIPGELFAGVTGAADYMFDHTFHTCSELRGPIPGELFAGISGAADYMFSSTFMNCTNLTGSIPGELFAGVTGAARNMFSSTFMSCSNLSGSIPWGLFGNVSGAPQSNMFNSTFRNCTNLTGPTARTADGTRLYDIVNPETGQKWIDEMPNAFSSMYYNTGINTDD